MVFALLNAFGLIVTAGYSLHIRSKFIDIFDELIGGSLPPLTAVMVNTHWTIWIFVTVILLTALFLKERISKKWIPLSLNALFVLVGIVYWAVFTIGMMFPLIQIIQEMGKG